MNKFMSKKIIIGIIFGAAVLYACIQVQGQWRNNQDVKQNALQTAAASKNKMTDTGLENDFSEDLVLEEAGEIEESKSQYWWLNSGAYLIQENGVGKTIQGNAEEGSKWQVKYKNYNADETDDGLHPQNIFRLVTRSKWQDYAQEAYYKITDYHLSKSTYRSESNGLLLFNRYQDENDLYYTGLRVDGAAVIKKKIKGEYFTLSYEPVFEGKYDRESNPDLLPMNTWIGIKSEVINGADGTVNIKLFIDRNRSGNWELVAEAKDDGVSYGGEAILNEGYAGIRTDFMDVEFDDYKMAKKD